MHAITGWVTDSIGNPHAIADTWGRNGVARQSNLPWNSYLNNSTCALTDHSLVVCGIERAGQGYKIVEYDLSSQPFQLIGDPVPFGDDYTNFPQALLLASGGLTIWAYQQVGPQMWLKAAYRPNGGTAWSFFDFQFVVPNSQIASLNFTVCQQANGEIWFFASRDGSGRFGLARFKESSGAIVVAADYIDNYFDRTFINGEPRDGDMSPGDELPCLMAFADTGRILLLYPKAFAQQFTDPGPNWENAIGYEHTVVVACYPDLSRQLLGVLPHLMDSHAGHPGALWVVPRGIAYMVPSFDMVSGNTCWQTGLIQNGKVLPNPPTQIPFGLMASSPDGYVAVIQNGGLLITTLQDINTVKRPK